MPALSRRQILLGAGAGTLLVSVGAARLFAAHQTRFLSAADDTQGGHCLLGMNAHGKINYCLPVPYRAHEARALTDQLAIYFARRPGRHCYIVDTRAGELVATLESAPGEHFCGHGCITADGAHLLLTTYAYDRRMGVVAIHETAPPFRRLGQFDTHGIDPHQLALLPGDNTLVVANGGILTHPDSDREMLNLDTMAPSLVYLSVESGDLLQQLVPPHHQISLRHLAVNPAGTVVIGAQDHTPGIEEHPHPLVFQHRFGEELRTFDTATHDWQQMNQYIASIAVSSDGRFAVSTTPRGNLVALWDLPGNRHIGSYRLRDVAGAAWVSAEHSFLMSNGLGQLVYLRLDPEPSLELVTRAPDLNWDNHLMPV